MPDSPVLLTGASSGIGAATARQAVDAGWRVVLTARREDRLSKLASELGGDEHALRRLLGARAARSGAVRGPVAVRGRLHGVASLIRAGLGPRLAPGEGEANDRPVTDYLRELGDLVEDAVAAEPEPRSQLARGAYAPSGPSGGVVTAEGPAVGSATPGRDSRR